MSIIANFGENKKGMFPTHPHSVYKYCPKCGSNQFYPQKDNSLKCEDCNFRFYYNAASSVAAIIMDEEGRLLLTRRALDPFKGTLDLPGGFVGEDESSEDALRREVQEELGADVMEYRYIRSYPNRYLYDGVTVFTNDAAFVCTLKSYSNLKAADDVSSFVWLYPEEVKLEEIGISSIRRIVKEYLESR